MGCGTSSAATTSSTARPEAHHVHNSTNNNNRSHPQRTPMPLVSVPLVKAKNYRHGAQITQGELNNQRSEFWSTRTEGNTIMWQSIRSAAEAMLTDDLPLANAILEASNLATPNGSLEVCYDERGYQYKVPQYCYANPLELTNEPVAPSSPTVETLSTEAVGGGAAGGLMMTSSGQQIKLRVRINPGDQNITVIADLNGSILQLKQLLVKEVGEKFPSIQQFTIPRQRIIFMGKELVNTMKIKEAKFDDSKVVQVFLRPVT